MIRLETVRNLLVLRQGETALITAVDSCGGIGALACDALAADPGIVGAYTARTPLMEVLAAGAEPAFASVSVSNAPEAARPILDGIRAAVGASLPLIVSTEKNMPTAMTAAGVTLTGTCSTKSLRLGGARSGDALYCVGLPFVGPEVLENIGAMPGPSDIRALLRHPDVRAVLPVGSQGVAAEARVLALESGLTAKLDSGAGVDLEKSGGPSTCLIAAAAPGAGDFGLPFSVTVIGRLV
jgi:hypothetical protein